MNDGSEALTNVFGCPLIREVDPTDIAKLKTLVAAGWAVVVSTSLTGEMLGPGFSEHGLAVAPLRGQPRWPEGHAWLLVGYDHVDGSKHWKYQGHFLALNSWGLAFPRKAKDTPGLCRIPFATLLTEGLEAYALRFRGS